MQMYGRASSLFLVYICNIVPNTSVLPLFDFHRPCFDVNWFYIDLFADADAAPDLKLCNHSDKLETTDFTLKIFPIVEYGRYFDPITL